MLGFFTTFTDDFPPNLGLLDQVEALKFIKEEISNFGGDPNKITIFGQSAGSASVSLHTYSPLSQSKHFRVRSKMLFSDLFQQSIQESGAMLTCYEDAVGPTNRLIEFAKHACGFSVSQWNTFHYEPLKNCLMNISINDGLKAQGVSFKGCGGGYTLGVDLKKNFLRHPPLKCTPIELKKDDLGVVYWKRSLLEHGSG